jgi:hypothetical protein
VTVVIFAFNQSGFHQRVEGPTCPFVLARLGSKLLDQQCVRVTPAVDRHGNIIGDLAGSATAAGAAGVRTRTDPP